MIKTSDLGLTGEQLLARSRQLDKERALARDSAKQRKLDVESSWLLSLLMTRIILGKTDRKTERLLLRIARAATGLDFHHAWSRKWEAYYKLHHSLNASWNNELDKCGRGRGRGECDGG